MQNYYLGIDFGTTYSCMAVWKDGGLVIIPNEAGERTTPSVVIFDGPDKVYVGEETLYHFPKNDSVKIYEIKRLLGKKYNQVQNILNYFPFKVVKETDGDRPMIQMNFGNKKTLKYYPEQIATLILNKLIKNAEAFLNTKIREVLITVPADFNENQKNAVRFAAEQLEGIKVLQVINEPSAAVLAYGFPKSFIQKKFAAFNKYFSLVKPNNIFHPMEEISMDMNSKISEKDDTISLIYNDNDITNDEIINNTQDVYDIIISSSLLSQQLELMKIIVFDLGGGTYDVSLIYVDQEKNFETKGYNGDQNLGGSDFDNTLIDYSLKYFCSQNNYDEKTIRDDYKCIQRLKRACEETKKYLSIQEEDTIAIENFYDSKPLCCPIKRSKFEELCEDLFKRLIKPLDLLLTEKNLNNTDIDEIILVGGSSKIPKVKEIISNKFKNVPINDQISPDEVVAYGAIIYAESLRRFEEKMWKDINYIDKTGHSIGIEIDDGSMQVIIKKGTKYPKSASAFFHTVYDFQYTFHIKVFEGENRIADDNELIGEFELSGIPKKPKGEVILKVTVNIDNNQTIKVTAFCRDGDVKENLIIDRKNQYPNLKNSDNLILRNNELNQEERKIQSIIFEYARNFSSQKTDQDRYNLIKKYNSAIIDYLLFFEENYNDTCSEKYLYLLEKLFKSYTYFFKTSLKTLVELNEKEEIKKSIGLFLSKINIKAPFRIKQLLNYFKSIKNEDFIQKLEIFVFAMDLLYQKAISNFHHLEKNHNLFAKTLFEESLIIANTFIIEKEDKKNMDPNILGKYNTIKEDSEKKIKILSALSLSEIEELKTQGKLFSNQSKLSKDDLNLLSYNLEMAVKKINTIENLNKNEEALETKSFYMANIVKIEFVKQENKMNLEHLEKYAMESISIAKNLKKNCKDKPWFKEIVKLREEIENKIKNEKPAPPIEDIDDIEEEFGRLLNIGNEELLRHILKKYPFPGYQFSEESIKEYKKNKGKFLLNLRKRYGFNDYSILTLNTDNTDHRAELNNKIIEYIDQMIEKVNEED